MELPQLYNNPFALIQPNPSTWQGLVGVLTTGNPGFLKFSNPFYGVRAGFINLVQTYLNKGLDTIAKIFPVYAPSGHGTDDDPQLYIKLAEQYSGIPRNQKISSYDDIKKLGRAIIRVEEGNFWTSEDDFNDGFIAAMLYTGLVDVADTVSKNSGVIMLVIVIICILIYIYLNRKIK